MSDNRSKLLIATTLFLSLVVVLFLFTFWSKERETLVDKLTPDLLPALNLSIP